MAQLRVRIEEGADPQPILLWDSVWFPGEGQADWAIAGAGEPFNAGGLQSKAALHTAVVLALFTDRRIPDDHPLRKYVGDDQRGWFGDGEDIREELGESDLGSLLWVFERTILTEETRKWVEAVALEALAPLIFQRAVVRIEAKAVAEFAFNRLDLFIELYGRDGAQVYAQRFENIWQQSVTSPSPKPFPPFGSQLRP
jgi:phage gp46-like protein